MALVAGTRLGAYEILSPLGTGGMGEVYRARDTRLGRHVAVKIVAGWRAGDGRVQGRLREEARAVAALAHPNILALYDVGDENGVTFVVTELLEGETLDARLVRGAIVWRRAVEIAAALAEGLAAAHARGIVHHDLKPANVFLSADGLVKILDFGIAESRTAPGASAPDETEPHGLAGTFGYMSPERLGGEPGDPRSDVFSLGCVLYEMIAGRPAFSAGSSAATLAAVLRDPPRISSVAAERCRRP